MRLNKKKVQLKMAELKINQAQLASKAGISRQTMSYIMNGRECRPDLFGKVADALDAKPEELID